VNGQDDAGGVRCYDLAVGYEGQRMAVGCYEVGAVWEKMEKDAGEGGARPIVGGGEGDLLKSFAQCFD